MDHAKVPRWRVWHRLKFVVSVLAEYCWSTGRWLGQTELSEVFDYGRTTVLETMEGFGPILDIVASQLPKLVQNRNHDDALKWWSHLSWTWSGKRYLVMWRFWQRFHTIWINQNGTSFTNIPTDQKLAHILEGKWLNGLSHNLVEGVYMDRRWPRKIYSHNEAR